MSLLLLRRLIQALVRLRHCALAIYSIPLAEIVVEEAVTRVESLEARGESNDEEQVIDVVGGGEFGVRSGAESEGFTFVDALRPANLIVESDPEKALDTSGMSTCKYHLYDDLWLF